MGWLLAEQSRFYLMLTGTIHALRTNASAAWTLAGLSFAYGVFHAAGPGHGTGVCCGDGSNAFTCSAHGHDHVHDASCGHIHAPDPSTLDIPSFSWSSALSTVIAAGARPCSGAILVLVFALAQGVYWAGIGAALAMAVGTGLTTGALAACAVFAKSLAEKLLGTEGGRGLIIARSAEFLAALLVLFVGVGLLLGASMMQGMA